MEVKLAFCGSGAEDSGGVDGHSKNPPLPIAFDESGEPRGFPGSLADFTAKAADESGDGRSAVRRLLKDQRDDGVTSF